MSTSYDGESSVTAAIIRETVWPWLMGACVEAWLRVRGNSPFVKEEARNASR